SIDDNFFDLGGHSLLATQLTSRIRTTLGTETTVQTLFEAPTVAELAGNLVAGAARPVLRPAVTRPERLPLSYAQQRLWFLHQLEGPSATYNMPLALRLTGDLDRQALRDAVNDVITRHEALRTVFHEVGGRPSQHITDTEETPIGLKAVRVDKAGLRQELDKAARHPFDLAAEAPFRATLFTVNAGESVLMLVVHHIAGDGWSIGQLAQDLVAAYSARLSGSEPQWPDLPVQYADYTLWQRELLGNDTDPDSLFARQERYWAQQLAGLPEQVTVPTDRPRPAVATYAGDVSEFGFDAELHQTLVQLARSTGTTLFMVLQASFAALMTRLGSGTDVTIGAPIAGRTDGNLEHLIGFFVNTLVLRTDTSNNPSFVDLLAQARRTSLAAYAHQDIPFEHLVEKLNPHRSTTHHPLFQISLGLQNTQQPCFDLPGLQVDMEIWPTGTSMFDLSITVGEERLQDGEPAGINGFVEFATDLYDRATVETLTARWNRLLRAVAADPDEPIGSVDILTPGEQERLREWATAAHPEIGEATLPELFEALVQAAPDALALESEAGAWTYAKLNARANQIAHWLISQGIGAEQLVGLALARGAEQIAAVLGIAKAGAGYLPVDPDYPAERIAYIIRDAAPSLVLTHEQLADDFRTVVAEADIRIRAIESVTTSWTEQPISNPTNADRIIPLTSANTAYTIYTSGSTGRPKGTAVLHTGLASLVSTLVERCRTTAGSRVLQLASPSFDASM
ncbi:condensation domain-containing protein, partial [Streptomyces sp. NPDC096136]|uniref:condensation domain-containing protein n=1 Tax=Streptomyces sp. NPDC096136 TaxID=3366076 RepID=UPI00381B1638